MKNKIKYITGEITFVGWKSENIRKKYYGSVNYWEQEAQAKRIEPSMPNGVFQIIGTSDEIDSIGTPPNSKLRVIYDPNIVDIDEIVEYLSTTNGITVMK